MNKRRALFFGVLYFPHVFLSGQHTKRVRRKVPRTFHQSPQQSHMTWKLVTRAFSYLKSPQEKTWPFYTGKFLVKTS